MTAIKIGMPLLRKWKSTLWRDLSKQNRYMDSATPNLLDMPFAHLNAPTTVASVIGAHWRSWSRTIHHTRAALVGRR